MTDTKCMEKKSDTINMTSPHIKSLFDLTGKVALLTGGAGQLAAQFAEGLVEAGAKLILTDILEEKLSLRKAEYQEQNISVNCYQADLSDQTSISEMYSQIEQEYSRLDILINNGGKTNFLPLEKMSADEFLEILDVHLKGSFLMVKHALPLMKPNGGAIINIGSIYGMVGADPGIYADSGINSSIAYAAAKGGILNFTRFLASYLAEYNIRVNCISPGGFYAGQDSKFVEKYCMKTPLGRMGDNFDLKGVGVFLASEAAKYITGVNIPVDGGWTAR